MLWIAACTPNRSSLLESERSLIGNWVKPISNGQVQGHYMEFHEDRTGVFGPLIELNGKVGRAPYMTLMMEDWRISNDTLTIQMKLQSGMVAYDSKGKEIKQNNKPEFATYIVWEISDKDIVLESLSGEYPSKDRYLKSERIGIIE